MKTLLMTLLLCTAATAHAKQTRFNLDRSEAVFTYDIRWKDAEGEKDAVTFTLPVDVATQDRGEETWVERKALAESQAKAVRKYAKTLPRKVTLRAKTDGPRVMLSVSGPRSEAKAALKEGGLVAEQARLDWMSENQVTELKGGGLIHDHALLVVDYADELAPVAAALAEGTEGDRDYVERVLSFVQSIPYEARKKKGGDPGYRRPIALLNRNKGDCDSKAVLFLALVHAHRPELDLAVVYVPEHALTGVALPAESGDRGFKAEGVAFLYAGPVGPAMAPLGQTAPANKKAGKKGEVRIVP